MKKRLLLTILAACIILAITAVGCSSATTEFTQGATNHDSLYQVSTYGALADGLFQGDLDFGTLKQEGDFGLGTLAGLDGEMVAVDGEYYQIRTDGKAYMIGDSESTPFADVTFFESDQQVDPPRGLDYSHLQSYLDGVLGSKNIFCAIRIEGTFSYVKARSVPAQSPPYPTLSEAIEGQSIFEYNDVQGVMVGFWCPSYTGNVCIPGYHLHFITSDRSAGGHVLDLRLGAVTISIDNTTDLQLKLPSNEEFKQADLQPKSAGE
jgi:acetolactate decarboxylase